LKYTHAHTRHITHTYTHTHTHTCTHTYIHHTYIHTYIHACIHTYMHTYMHTYIHTYRHTYIHTHIHTHTYIQGCQAETLRLNPAPICTALRAAAQGCPTSPQMGQRVIQVLICMPYMYASRPTCKDHKTHIQGIHIRYHTYKAYICALFRSSYVCLICVIPYMYALYVCLMFLICRPYMCALCVCYTMVVRVIQV